MKRRGSGILLHLTSLPSRFGIGDMGPEAYDFIDFLTETNQSVWQLLPLNATGLGRHHSPYHSISAYGCNPMLISPERLLLDGLLSEEDLKPIAKFPEDRVDFSAALAYREKLFHRVYERFQMRRPEPEYLNFCEQHAGWLEDFALFLALKRHFAGRTWNEWPSDLRDREETSLRAAGEKLREQIEKERMLQFIFFKQWASLKSYGNERGIQIFGDVPIYVDYDSVDVWAYPEMFKLDAQKRPYVVAGVPPDYFSATGQLWGNPIYRWDFLRERGYDWWVSRIRHNLMLFDLIRIDHFRGLVAYWEVPATETHAINGQWIEAPAMDLLNRLIRRFPCLPIVAEDLGVITPDVREVMHHFGLPGMKLLLFAFGEDMPTNPYIPHNLSENSIAYTGTHDNNTARGWFENEATPEEKKRLFQYLGQEVPVEQLHWELIRLVMMSRANLAMIPMQDILGLGEEARMNRPATSEGNWQWRLAPNHLTQELSSRLADLTEIYGRA